jgi:hypothetical protein
MSLTTSNQKSGRLNIILWAAQALLAAFYGMVGFFKLTKPIPDLAAMMVWPGVMPEWFVRFVGTAEFAGALGLIPPMATKFMPRLTPPAAPGLFVPQRCAIIFHISRGELQVLPMNLVLLALPAFIIWGRWFKAA